MCRILKNEEITPAQFSQCVYLRVLSINKGFHEVKSPVYHVSYFLKRFRPQLQIPTRGLVLRTSMGQCQLDFESRTLDIDTCYCIMSQIFNKISINFDTTGEIQQYLDLAEGVSEEIN